MNLGDQTWVGSLGAIDATDGYWIKMVEGLGTAWNYESHGAPTAPLSIGLVAQEAETVSPGLVENTGVEEQDSNGHAQPKFDADGNRETVKTLKYSVLYMKAIKCLQEAQARIETLETKVATLEAASD